MTRRPGDLPPTGLPVEHGVEAVRAALRGRRHAVLEAPPGAGKTTVVPLRLLDEPWLGGGRIVMLEPRRLAARAAATRMASLLGEPVGATVGYLTRDERKVGPATRIEVVTEGILTRRLQNDPSLEGVGLVVFDEIHERSLHADLGLALLLEARAALRPDLRVLAMSATLDASRLAALLERHATVPAERGGDAVVRSEGRAYPVDVRWEPPPPRTRPAEAVAAAVRRALRTESGDVLVFLAGAGDIRRVEALLRDLGDDSVDVRTLFGALTQAEQDLALAPSPPGRRRVVLSTDIAETSLTVDGIRVVVDSGQVRSPHHDARSGLTRLRTGTHSRASAEQRAGRAGRQGPGVAIRLWSKMEQATRRPFADPEILTVDLTALALELAVWGADAPALPFLDPPPAHRLGEAATLLRALGALDDAGRVTPTGRAMAELPLHPRLARMVVVARSAGGGALACILAALLDEHDVIGGRRGEQPTDLALRVQVVTGGPIRGWEGKVSVDRRAVEAVRRRSRELARRAGIGARALDRLDRSDPGGTAVDRSGTPGAILALAYPDRIAQTRGGGRFRLRNGTGAWVPDGDALRDEPFLVVADLEAGGGRGGAGAERRVDLAAAIDEGDVVALVGGEIDPVVSLRWDAGRDDLRARVERRVDALVFTAVDEPVTPGDAARSALLARVRDTSLGVLRWTDAARVLQSRLAYAHRTIGSPWPDVSDGALLADLDDWLAPRLSGATGRADLEGVDVVRALRDLAGHHRLVELDRVVPTTVRLFGGRTVVLDYSGEAPAIAVRAQDLYGTTTHPTIAGGRVPLVVQVLSPAGRPIQVTSDLPGFWDGSWKEVRKEMAGRYPRHDWPADPARAQPGARPRPRPRR